VFPTHGQLLHCFPAFSPANLCPLRRNRLPLVPRRRCCTCGFNTYSRVRNSPRGLRPCQWAPDSLQKTASSLSFPNLCCSGSITTCSQLLTCLSACVTEYARRSLQGDFGKIEYFDMNAAFTAAVCREGVDPDVILWIEGVRGR
jgi:hypothetical protein